MEVRSLSWQSSTDVDHWLQSRADTDRLTDLYALARLVEVGVIAPTYRAHDNWAQIAPLGAHGQELASIAFADRPRPTAAELARALFALFFHHDFLVDPGGTDPAAILAQVSGELQAREITWPYLFGRTLYDKFNDTATSDRTDHLEADEVQVLLADTPVGVYQLGTLLTGPFGILRSAEARFVPPTATVPLWHCSDSGCRALHSVHLRPPNAVAVQTYNHLRNRALEAFGPPSEWSPPFNRLCRTDRGARPRPYYDLTAFIANAIVGPDRVALLTAALQTQAQELIRSTIAKRSKIGAEGAPEAVATRLGAVEQLHLLLLLPDTDLVQLIDRAVLQGRINVPFTEIRTARLESPWLNTRDRGSQLSSLGLRAKPRVALAALHSTIWDSYERAGLLPELGWKLRRRPDPPPRSALMDYIRATDVRDVIKDLIVASMPITKAVADVVSLPLDSTDQTDALTDRLLWRLGFEPKAYREGYARLKHRLLEFNETTLRVGDARAEDDRERVRAIGVNLFVSVEDFLSELISFNTWLLSSDHFLSTRFWYDPRAALQSVPGSLGQSVTSGQEEFRWSADGANTLGTLLVYAQKLVTWTRDLTSRDRSALKRSDEDLPHFVDDPEQFFAFRHTALWGDTDGTELLAYVRGLEAIIDQLSRAGVAAVRNGLDHPRDDREFPSSDTMLACAARLRDAFEFADLHRFIPKEFWLHSRNRDRYGKETLVFTDYQGREVTLGGPSVVSGLPEARFRTPVVIAPGNLLGFPHAELRFAIREPSAYADYWAGYPRRRRIPSPHRGVQKDEILVDER